MPPTVEELFDRWRSQRDHRALAAVFDRTAPEVWRVARHLSGDRSEADDLLQATFLAAMESAGHWRHAQPLVPWLLGILTNKLRLTRRRQRQREARRPELAATRPTPAPSDPVADASHGELRERLKDRLAALPEVYRAVLVLHLEHGLSALEIADALGRPRATVRSQLHRGLELLRRDLPSGLRAPANDANGRPDLRSVRAAVLIAAGGSATIVPLSVGITVMAKKLVLGVALVLAAGLWYGWPRSAPPVPPPKTPSSTPVATAPETAPAMEQTTEPPTTARTPLVEAPRGVGSLRVHVRWADGAPAVAMKVCVQPVTANDWFAQTWRTTDGRGIAEYHDLAPGKVQVRTGHGGSREAVNLADAVTEVELTIPVGIDVRGTVVDPDGRLLGGAIIAVGTSSEDVLEVARTEANGTFFLRSVAGRNRVAAFADGFAGSQVLAASQFSDGPQELRLAGIAGGIAGRVLDADGRALVGAWVAHGYALEARERDGKFILAAMRVALTDAAGEFRLQAVPLGMSWPLHAGALGHATWKGSVRVTDGEVPFVEIRLERAVQLHGTLRDESGAPVRGHVSVIDCNSPGLGIGDQRPQWSRPFAGTRADGAYAFRNLPAGELVVSASDNHGKVASRTFQAQPGDQLKWDPVLVGDLAIRGRLLDDGGQPLADWRVVARGPEGQPTPSDSTTDADGNFAMRGCAQVAYAVRCYAKGDWHQAIVEQPGVEPGGAPLVLRVSRTAMPTCFVHGRLADDETVAGLRVLVVGERSGLLMSEPLRPGDAFEFGPMPPERFALQLQRLVSDGDQGEPLVVALGDHRLQVGERLDLGTVRTPPLGELDVTLVDAAGQPVAKGTVPLALFGAPMGGISVEIVDGHGSKQLAPGTYLPTTGINRTTIEHAPIVIVSGERTDAQLRIADAVHRQVRYDLTAVGVPMRADATWKKAGQPLQRHWFGFWQEHPTTIDHHFTPGAWELELELGTGVVQRFPFVVSTDASGPVIEIRVAQ